LPTVTLIAATSVNVAATIKALDHCLDLAAFADCLLFTDDRSEVENAAIRRIDVARMTSSSDYSRFMLQDLVEHIRTDHVLVVQWDGFILNPGAWDPVFLDFDYIGAPWPQFGDGHDVGNGGFSLRSKRLLEACRDPAFVHADPEDVAICRLNRALLEDKHGLRFAPRMVADHFAYERTSPPALAFGFHGIFNMIDAIGAEDFWAVYRSLDERGTASRDTWTLMRQLRLAEAPAGRRARVLLDRLFQHGG
jgi:hypothetical protein